MKQKLALNFLVSIAISLHGFSQNIDTLYSENLQRITLNSLDNDDFLVISNTNCVSCVNYLMESKLFKNVIIITQNLSIVELQRLKTYYKIPNNSKLYFYNNANTSKAKGPYVLLNKNQIVTYEDISILSNDFNIKPRKFYRHLIQTYNNSQQTFGKTSLPQAQHKLASPSVSRYASL